MGSSCRRAIEGLSAGVMVAASIWSLLIPSMELAEKRGMPAAIPSASGFLLGIIFFLFCDRAILGRMLEHKGSLDSRRGLMSAFAVTVHNFPEGMATFTSSLKDPYLGTAIAIAIAIHNIPEGIATSLPIYFSTGSKKKAFLISFLSGITEPIGAIVGYLVLRPFFNDTIFGLLFSAVAGIMVFISLEELIPMAHEYEKSKITIIGVIIGMIVMAVSLLLFI